MKWSEWKRTNDRVQEWTRWDMIGDWFCSVVKKGLVWEWYVAYAPDDGTPKIEYRSWALTRNRAMHKTQAWVEQHVAGMKS